MVMIDGTYSNYSKDPNKCLHWFSDKVSSQYENALLPLLNIIFQKDTDKKIPIHMFGASSKKHQSYNMRKSSFFPINYND
jgi:hypothetical protein